ncbi:MAG: prepilin-type N-terminal cleavage/methylation domain-containing protein, partial [Planctomycetota bacterium]
MGSPIALGRAAPTAKMKMEAATMLWLWVNNRRRSGRSASRPRAGFTLMEIILVLALLIIVGSVVWMQLRSPWESVRLR